MALKTKKMTLKTKKWDVAEFLNTREDVLAYLNAALEENDPTFFRKALGDVARSKGMAEVARSVQVGRESLYKSLSDRGNPSFNTVFGVLDALDLRVSIIPKVDSTHANDDFTDNYAEARLGA